MARDEKTNSATEKRNEYAFWTVPGGTASVVYSLPLFHEIDFLVNEGYRKIPHGGIEEGGLLFGVSDASGTRIEAFRQMHCEHASGPSFLLSDTDLEALSQQLAAVASDPELEGMKPLGWFIAHTRGPLVMTDREAQLFDHYFPAAGSITILVKPERFQPTRFGFLVRGNDKKMPRDASQSAVILPLPGRSGKAPASGPVASIPAPAVNVTNVKRATDSAPEVRRAQPPAPVDYEEDAEQIYEEEDIPERAPRHAPRLTLDKVTPRADDVPPVSDDEEESARLIEPPPPEREEEGRQASGKGLGPVRRGGLEPTVPPVLAGSAVSKFHDVDTETQGEVELDPYRQVEILNRRKPPSNQARMVMVLPLAALLGCLVGYVAYLQVPSQIVPLSAKSNGRTVVITWPAEQTRSASYAAVRVNGGNSEMLTPEERGAGRVEVSATSDIKVELTAHNWLRESHGIVRFIRPPSP